MRGGAKASGVLPGLLATSLRCFRVDHGPEEDYDFNQ